jgi:hypothetical protein
MAEHTPTPWEVETRKTRSDGMYPGVHNRHYYLRGSGHQYLGTLSHWDITPTPANARYIVAAVNECSAVRLSTEALESGAVAGLVEAARRVQAGYDDVVEIDELHSRFVRLYHALAALEDT